MELVYEYTRTCLLFYVQILAIHLAGQLRIPSMPVYISASHLRRACMVLLKDYFRWHHLLAALAGDWNRRPDPPARYLQAAPKRPNFKLGRDPRTVLCSFPLSLAIKITAPQKDVRRHDEQSCVCPRGHYRCKPGRVDTSGITADCSDSAGREPHSSGGRPRQHWSFGSRRGWLCVVAMYAKKDRKLISTQGYQLGCRLCLWHCKVLDVKWCLDEALILLF